MKLNRFLTILLCVSLAFCACQQIKEDFGEPAVSTSVPSMSFDVDAAEQILQLTATREWATQSYPDWIAITPSYGKPSNQPQTITVTVLPNPDMDREATVVFTIGLAKTRVKVTQRGEAGTMEEALIYKNDFDAEVATQSFGTSGTSWPYLDQFEGWRNESGNGLEGMTYEFASVSVRNNSNSDGSYSDYDGSGKNNLLFAGGNKFVIKDLTVSPATSFALTFGTERYMNGADDNTFKHSEFHVFVSDDNERWVELDYTFPNGEKSGRWDQATSKFSVPEGTEKLSFYFKSDLASGHRVDDIMLMRSGSTSEPIDFSQGGDISGSSAGIGTKDAFYYNNFDKAIATQSFGAAGNSWPYLDQFDGWNNERGSGIANVNYDFKAISVRANSNSNAGYSDYPGSGENNLMFGSGNYLAIKNIDLGGKTAVKLAFGTEKYLFGADDNTFLHSEFHVYVSDNGEKWVEVQYAFPNGDKAGRWDLASTSFNVPAGTSSLCVYFTSDIASGHRLDDVLVTPATDNPTETLDFSQGIELGGGSGGGANMDTSNPVYYNNFDAAAATQTFGTSGTSWPFLDQFDGWKNARGSGVGNETYIFKSISARANSNSDGSYSDYPGSGANNLMFGGNNYFAIRGIALGSDRTYKLQFGTEKYLYGSSDNTFVRSEFHVYVSVDGSKWVPVEYAFPGAEKSGRWDLATTTFTVPDGAATLGVYMISDITSGHRVDDILLNIATADATTPVLDFANGVTLEGDDDYNGGGGGGGSTTGPGSANDIFYNNFDQAKATQTYGSSGNSWPYLDQFEGWKNHVGTGASGVEYSFKSITARANSTSNSNYSDYSGSGDNNLFFGQDGLFIVKNINLGANQSLTLMFGTEKFVNTTADNTFTPSEWHVYLSVDAQKWTEIEYTFPNGFKSGRWDVASSTFNVPPGTAQLSIYFKSDLASAHRLDDVILRAAESATTTIDFSNGIELPGGDTTGGGGDTYTPPVNPMSISDIIAADDETTIAASSVYVGAVTTRGFVATNGRDHIYVYAAADPGVKVGDIVDFYGTKTTYYGLPEITGPTVNVVSSGNTVPYPQAQDITTSFDNFTSGSYDYVTYQATMTKSGNYTNFKVDGATVYQGSLSNAPSTFYNGLAEGDNVTITGYYNGKNENNKLLNVIAVSVVKEGSSGGGQGGGTTGGNYDSNLSWEVSKDNASYSETATVNGTAGVPVLKVGTSTKAGTAGITIPAGTKKVSFYGIAWKGKAATCAIKDVTGATVYSQAFAANEGLANNSPYTLTVGDSDKYEWVFASPLSEAMSIIVTTEGTNTRVALFAINAYTE